MILSNTSIQMALDNKWLVIEPEPLPREPPEEGGYCPYATTAVDLTLGDRVSWFKEGLAINIDLRRGSFRDLFGPNSVSTTITEEAPYPLVPEKFVIGVTRETVHLPIHKKKRGSPKNAPCLAARVEGKSSYSRCGLLVHFTAPTIHAGFNAVIALELRNLGKIPIMLYPGAPICQLIIEQVDRIPFRVESQFQHQTRPSGE